MTLHAYIRKEEKSQINNLSCFFNTVEKKKQNKSETSRRKEKIKGRNHYIKNRK
jgi:hypothetical protein